jgi:hypothetical protein
MRFLPLGTNMVSKGQSRITRKMSCDNNYSCHKR